MSMLRKLLFAGALALVAFSATAEVWQARYGVAETFNFRLYNADGTLDVDEADGGTEVSLSCNEAAETTATNDFVDEGTFYSIALTSGEMQCERIAVVIAATTTEVFFIQTNSHASAMTPANDVNLVNIAGSAVSTSTAQLGVNVVNAAGTAWGSGAITAASIATDAITAAKIAADAIGASEIAADAIGAAEVANATIDAATFASAAIDAAAIATDAIGAAEIATDAIGAAEIAANAIAAAEIADGAIDEATFATTAGSFDALGIVDQGTAQSATSTTLQLRSAAAFADDEVIGATCVITGGSAGVGQARTISDYVASTDTATVETWTTTPTGTITYQCFGTAASTGGSGLDAAGVRAAVGLASANLDTQLSTIDNYIDTEVADILTDTSTTLDDLVDDIESRLGTPSNLGGGATVAANLSDIEGQTDDIGVAGAGLTAADDSVMTRLGAPVGASMSADIADVRADIPGALVSGRMDVSVGAYQTGLTPLQPTVAGRTLDVSAGGEAGVDWANVGSPTTTLNLSGTTIATSQQVASVSGAVGSVTGNVGGNVIGFVGSVNTNGISAASLAPDAGTEIATATWAATTRELTSGLNIVLAKGVGLTGLNDLSAAQVNTEADTALSDIFLDQLLASPYDPASPPGATDSLLEDLIENGSGIARFTTSSLVNAPTGGGGGSSDWSTGEREQIRHRLGVDGTASAPSATPSLASAASIAALNNVSIAQIRDMIVEDMGGGVSQGCVDAVLLAFAAGDISTSSGTTTWRDPSNGEVRIVSTVTSNGNRTSTVTCPTY